MPRRHAERLGTVVVKAREIADLLGGVCEGDGEREITGGNATEAAGPREAAFVDGARKRPLDGIRAGCVLVPPGFPATDQLTLIRVAEPRNAFARLLRVLHPEAAPEPGVHPSAAVAGSARLAPDASVGPLAVIGPGASVGAGTWIGAGVVVSEGAAVGANCRLHPGVVLYPGVTIGDRTVLHAGAVIGADGFGLVFERDHYEKFPQRGSVEIGSDVEIGANSTIDRGALGSTVIGDGAKLDNLVHIGHNCRIGRHVVIAAQTGLSGGVAVEDYVVMGGQVGIGEKAQIGAKAVLGGQCGPLPGKRLAGGATYWGTPARPYREQMERLALVSRLPELFAELKRLRERVEELERE